MGHLQAQRSAEHAGGRAFFQFVTHVDCDHRRHGAIVNAAGEFDVLILAAAGSLPRFERRGGRAQHQGNALVQGATSGNFTGVITRWRFLLERGFVFFVNDDQPQVWGRREHRAAGSHDDLYFAGGDVAPVMMTFGVAHVAVQHGHTVEPLAESSPGLGRETDLGHQNNGLSAEGDDLLNGSNIDLSFSASGDAMQENRVMLAGVDRLFDGS